ncbi:uncharacterized protein LOC129340341 [Eublepharis macularius]|uniref:Uncharacterized protein LOC129340341 n=1 Tax=Eublepharis macularius TaxID=481883 RepID=A0AA97LD75_EUBMA|nr:uncharacterized protein LOC129340341 [Eublepharis macularius]
MEMSRAFCQTCHDAEHESVAHYGPELEVLTSPAQSSRKKREPRRHGLQPAQETPETHFGLSDLGLAADNSSLAPYEDTSQLAALQDHNAYCVPEEAAPLKSLVISSKEVVHQQSELLLSLQGALEASQKECRELQEKAAEANWPLHPKLGESIAQLEAENRNLCCERDQLKSTAQRLRRELDASGATVLSLSRQLRGQQEAQAYHGAFSLETVKENRKWLRFYTGFDEYPRFTAFLDFLLDSSGQRQEESPERWTHSALSPQNQVFLVLVRLRLGLLLQDLAFRFHISESTASRYWLSWTEVMEQKLKQIPVSCSQRYVDTFKPQRLIRHHDMPLVALDCAELFFEAQGRTRSKEEVHWGPRGRYSIPGYALAAPSGYLTFGSGADKELASLPTFLQVGPVVLSAQQEAAKRQVLSFRSLTDKALSFRFLRVVHPQNMEGQVGRAWTISCYLACLLHEPMGLA